ncbi:MAG TPA: CoA transferase [Myxococcota bacterium]|nr:CoA transferase [Myxococcota bacterium]
MLSPYRVIDLACDRGILCGQILADLGADVIQVEPRAGSALRRAGPFYCDEPGRERSLAFWAYARGKRSIALDLDGARDRGVLQRLIAGADFLIESEPPGRLESLGFGDAALEALQPGLVHVSITPFGRDGPKSGWAATDLTLVAAAGLAHLNGEAGHPPVRCSVPQAWAHAAADAAVGALIAHFERKRTGRGQHVDIAAQQSLTLGTQFRSLDAPLSEAPARRLAGGVFVAGRFIPLRYRLRDGWVALGPAFLPSTGHFMKRLLGWALEEGFGDPGALDENWGQFALRIVRRELSPDAIAPLDATLSAFFATRTKAEVVEAACKRKLLLAPILDLGEFADSPQLAAREFAVELAPGAAGAPLRFPGPFARFERTPIRYALPPPRLDEHGAALRAEPARPPAPAGRGEPGAPPLAGVRILDLFWILAGPGGTRMLADYGAEVIHVESTTHLDTLRVIPPYQYSNPHPEGAGGFQCANANKLGITLDLCSAQGREIVLELVRRSDVVTESFAPGVIDHYGLGWEALREVKPDLIMISSCLLGQSGPWRDLTGFGNLAAAITGFQQLASWPGNPPAGPYAAYTDFIGVRYNALAILAALEYRDRTGLGQCIDMAQGEAALHFLAPAFLDYAAHRRIPAPCGNADRELHPHGIYPCAGEEAWVALAARDDRDWGALCAAIGRADLLARRAEREIVDAAIADWTRARSTAEAEAALQAHGVPAHAVLDMPGLFACPQLQHRGHFVEIGHEIFGSTTIESSRLRFSRSRERVPERAIGFGRDNRAVLEGILGYSPERVAELEASGVLR